jgi:hypothetical protein
MNPDGNRDIPIAVEPDALSDDAVAIVGTGPR